MTIRTSSLLNGLNGSRKVEREVVMDKIKKALQTQLFTHAKQIMLDAGFVATPGKWREYTIETPSGRLDVTPRVDRHGVDFFAIHEDVEKAVANGIPCNPYSGKNNYLCLTEKYQIDYVIELYRSQ